MLQQLLRGSVMEAMAMQKVSACWAHQQQHQATAGAATAAAQARPQPAPQQQQQHQGDQQAESLIRWVFLGPPGVGKGTYASHVAKQLGVAHIATGDLIRDEIKADTPLGQKMKGTVAAGQLVPDQQIFSLLRHRLDVGAARGELGFILDGFPRTRAQAEVLLSQLHIQLALNLSLREEVLVEKCLGRRLCKHCGKNYNVADIHLPASADGCQPEIRMPPLMPPSQCAPHLEVRADDKMEVVRARLQVYKQQAEPVEQMFKAAGVLQEFEITGGIPETLPSLVQVLRRYLPPGTSALLKHHKEHLNEPLPAAAGAQQAAEA